MDIGMTGKEWRLVIDGPGDSDGVNVNVGHDLSLEYSGHKYKSEKDSDCSVGGWDGNNWKTAQPNVHRQMDCYFEC
jgi:hypothetical protein